MGPDPDLDAAQGVPPNDALRQAVDVVEAAIADAGGLAQLALRSGVSKQTLGRYRRGEFPWERKNHQLAALDRYLAERHAGEDRASGPGLVELVKRAAPANRPRRRGASQADATDKGGSGTDPTAGPDRPRNRLRFVWAIGAAVAVAVVAVLVAALSGDEDDGGRGGATALVPSFTAPVDGTGPGEDPTEPVTVWDRPATTICSSDTPECDPEAERVGVVQAGQVVDTLCVAKGQVVRNGPPGEPGFYDDDRWVMIDIDGTKAYLSNTWYARSGLPRNLPSCPPHD